MTAPLGTQVLIGPAARIASKVIELADAVAYKKLTSEVVRGTTVAPAVAPQRERERERAREEQSAMFPCSMMIRNDDDNSDDDDDSHYADAAAPVRVMKRRCRAIDTLTM